MDESIEFITQIIQSKEAKIYSQDSELYLELNITMGVKKEKVKIKLNKGKIEAYELLLPASNSDLLSPCDISGRRSND